MANPKRLDPVTSDYNRFLFSPVGTQSNGSELTLLSLFAYLGSDPWAEADRLAGISAAVAADWLAEKIAQMPLTAQAIDEARTTASRLIPLLPARSVAEPMLPRLKGSRPTPIWVTVAIVGCALTIGYMAGSRQSAPTTAVAPASQAER